MLKLFIYFFVIIEFGGFLNFFETDSKNYIKDFWIDGEKIRVTCEVDEMFLGLYEGEKTGYLSLKKNGILILKKGRYRGIQI
jgi:hypothetical protein